MGTGQTILTIGALTLLSFSVLLTNRSSLQYGSIINQTEIDIYSVSLAESIIEEAAGRAFDHYSASDTASDGAVITSLTQLTDPALLGAEGDDNYTGSSGFDDFDDYNSWYSHPYVVYVPGVDSFHIQAQVFYVDTTNPDLALNTRTWHKKMIVKVWPTITPWGETTASGKAKPDTVIMSYLYSYWWFR
ncbi:MAG: hypothetical protein ABSE41_14175 [Bacteroidota bacterium]